MVVVGGAKGRKTPSRCHPAFVCFCLLLLSSALSESPANKKSTRTIPVRVRGSDGAFSAAQELLCGHLVAAFRAFQAKKRRNRCTLQTLLMGLLS